MRSKSSRNRTCRNGTLFYPALHNMTASEYENSPTLV